MPATTEKQRRFMGADYARKKRGEKTRTGMSESQLKDFASKPGAKFTKLVGRARSGPSAGGKGRGDVQTADY